MLIPLSDKSGKRTWVNAFLVRDVRERKAGCDVVYGPSGHVRTDESAEDVVARINDAMLAVSNAAGIAAIMNQSTGDSDDGAAALGAVL
ncbi:MAG: hypothetical protein ACF8QF_01695 [Phycisphaerales bacterium]